MEYIEALPENGGQTLRLKGDWTISNAAAIQAEMSRYRALAPDADITVDAHSLAHLDTSGAWLLRQYFPRARLEKLTPRQQELIRFIPEAEQAAPQATPTSPVAGFFIKVGEATSWSCDFIYAFFSFLGGVFIRILKNFIPPMHFRLPALVRHIHETGVQALPIICLLAFGISMVISYQGAIQLQKFGADIYTIDLTVISLLREMAVLTTAIMVAGRSGSAFAAEIGVMKMRGEIDAMQTMGLNPFETLVVPRLLALLLTLPALSFIADIIGLAGGGLMSAAKLEIPLPQYISRVQSIITPTMFFIGMMKAPVFALLITAVGCFQGMNATGSAENVGKLTTLAVVQSIFLVIMADALFSVLFSRAGI